MIEKSVQILYKYFRACEDGKVYKNEVWSYV